MLRLTLVSLDRLVRHSGIATTKIENALLVVIGTAASFWVLRDALLL